jgi:hypothetical protein
VSVQSNSVNDANVSNNKIFSVFYFILFYFTFYLIFKKDI